MSLSKRFRRIWGTKSHRKPELYYELNVESNNFEIKPAYIRMVSQYQFRGLSIKEPNVYLASFLNICDTFIINSVNSNVIHLRLFPFSLRDKAKLWLSFLALNSITL